MLHSPLFAEDEAPTSREIADVTVMIVWCELQNSPKIDPLNKHA